MNLYVNGHRSPAVPTVSSSVDKSPNKDPAAARLAALQQLTQRQLELIGENPSREGLRDTPARVAMAFSQLTCGYTLDVHEVVGGAIYKEDHRGMILVRDIEMYSLCEHHLLPMFGRVHVAYVPDGRVIGLSKLPRLVEVFARRLQLQERLTQQIANAVEEVLQPSGVAVLIDAVHLCMMMRGIEKQSSSTVTTAFRGAFLDDHGTREEFYRLVRGRRG
jgi:GTP cyclohydrolase I